MHPSHREYAILARNFGIVPLWKELSCSGISPLDVVRRLGKRRKPRAAMPAPRRAEGSLRPLARTGTRRFAALLRRRAGISGVRDLVRCFERLPAVAARDMAYPNMMLVFTRSTLVFDRMNQRLFVVGLMHPATTRRQVMLRDGHASKNFWRAWRIMYR